jgi:hypothetical protein
VLLVSHLSSPATGERVLPGRQLIWLPSTPSLSRSDRLGDLPVVAVTLEMQPQQFPDFAHGQPDICHSALSTKLSIVPPLTRVVATSNSCSQWRGNRVLFAVEPAFTLPWNSCSFCRGIPVHFGVEIFNLDFQGEDLANTIDPI